MSKYDESDLFKDIKEIDGEISDFSRDSIESSHDDIECDTFANATIVADAAAGDENLLGDLDNTAGENMEGDEIKVKKPRKSKNKIRLNLVQLIKFVLCIFLVCALLGAGYVTSIIVKAPKIETDNIYSLLSQSSVLYDDQGKIIETVYGDQNRTLADINDIPQHVKDAFISLEDKTFETHSGFNIIRIFGAIRDSILGGGGVSGTSTITQQLARNLYLADIKSERSISRKITEAYYTIQLEQKLDKDQILEAYLNTVFFGSNQYGIQTASQFYFSKDVSELSIAQGALLASIPQLPSVYAPIIAVPINKVDKENDIVVAKADGVAYICNDSAKDRMELCLDLMKEQGHIDEEQYKEAKSVEIKDIINPNLGIMTTNSGYFNDFVMSQIIDDLMEQYDYDENRAINIAYNGGLNIYTTLDTQAQSVLNEEFSDESNFPYPTSYRMDGDRNIIDDYGKILLYRYSNLFDSKNNFVLRKGEFKWNDDGSLLLYAGEHLHFYDTIVNGETDYSIEFKSMYFWEDDEFYCIPGGYINVPQKYKSKDDDENLIISAEFFKQEEYKDYIVKDDSEVLVKGYTLQDANIQPQGAMTIIDNSTGAVKAMIGGRNISGRMLYNRATSTRQPGSSLKPLTVYAAALQRSYEYNAAGQYFPFEDHGIGKQGTKFWGNYITAGSVVLDEPTYVGGKKWPNNVSHTYSGFSTLRKAIEQSTNVCAVKIVDQVGLDYSYKIGQNFGLSALEESDISLAALSLGGLTRGVSTLEMASAYSTFVNGGVHKSYSCYTKVTNRKGEVILEPKITETEVLNEGVAWIMRDMLQSTVTNGIAGNAAISGERAGGKSGTTDSSVDLWFDGFTASYSASLWMGSDVNMPLSSMSSIATRLWGRIMRQIDGAYGGTYSERPSNVIATTIDTKSGLLATEKSASTRTEYFTAGTQPTDAGSLYEVKTVCKDSNYLATPVCEHTVDKQGIVMPYKLSDTEKKLYGALPETYCNLHNPDPKKYPVKEGLPVTIVEEKPPEEKPGENPGTPGENPGENPGGTPGENPGENPGGNPGGTPSDPPIENPVEPNPPTGDSGNGTGDSGTGR